jgi:exodeoxyribonuclease VII small subunit
MPETSIDKTSSVPLPPEIAGLSYEEAREHLIDVVKLLESGGVSLEESLAAWERGEQLAQRCQEWLDGAQARLDAVRAE